MFDYVIYHKNCYDGFCGFFILSCTGKIMDDATIYPDVPSAKFPPPNLHNKTVIIIDVAYKKSVLEKIFSQAKYVLFIDHHITIKNDVVQLITMYNEKHDVVYNDEKSGASLVWNYFYPKKTMPWFVKYIEDNDIGRWKYKHTIPFILALHVNYPTDLSKKNLTKWHELYDASKIKHLIKLGNIYSQYEENLLESNAKKYSLESFPSEKLYNDFKHFFEKPGQYKVAVVNGNGCPSVSLLGNKIVSDINCDFCIIWSLHMDRKEYVLSFRSKTTNVGDIAKLFDGGGHTLASACSIPLTKYSITDLFFPNSLPRN